jgi:Skp family chaperone for outer membrane proteins
VRRPHLQRGTPVVRNGTDLDIVCDWYTRGIPGAVQGVTAKQMKRTFVSIVVLVLSAVAVLAQASSAATPAPASSTPATPTINQSGVKVGVIDMQGAIAGSNEGQRDFEALAKKFEPRRLELQKQNTDIEDLKKQLSTQGDKMNPEAHETLVKSIENKTKSLQRSAEDAQNEFQQQQNEIAQRILQKMAPVITKYVSDNGYGLLIDASAPWPQGPVVVATQAVDITKAVVDAYNVQSGVPAPAKPAASTTPRPAGTTPATTKPPASASTTPTKPATATSPKQ